MPCALPYDIFVTTLGAEHHDPEERLWLRSTRAPGALTVRDVLGNAGGGARLLLAAGARALEGTLALGGAEPVRVDAWLRRVNGRSRAFVAADGHTYTWTHDRPGVWKCTNDAGHVVAEGSDDEFRTLTIDQKLPWLGVELFVSFLIMHELATAPA